MNKDNLVSCDDLAGSKIIVELSPIPIKSKVHFMNLTYEKIQEDQKYDGYYSLRNKQNRFISKRSY